MAKADNKVVLEILKGARNMLAKKRGIWCTGSLAEVKNSDGTVYTPGETEQLQVLLEGIPHRVCALGAMYAQTGALKRKSKNVILITPEGHACETLLEYSTPNLEDGDGSTYQPSIVDYNDDHAKRKEQIIAVFDRAIEKAEQAL